MNIFIVFILGIMLWRFHSNSNMHNKFCEPKLFQEGISNSNVVEMMMVNAIIGTSGEASPSQEIQFFLRNRIFGKKK